MNDLLTRNLLARELGLAIKTVRRHAALGRLDDFKTETREGWVAYRKSDLPAIRERFAEIKHT